MAPLRNGLHGNVTRFKGDTKKLIYMRISAGPQRGIYVHRLIAEAMLGRPLEKSETVDHIDGNTLNNHPSNLRVLTWAEHGRVTRWKHRRSI